MLGGPFLDVRKDIDKFILLARVLSRYLLLLFKNGAIDWRLWRACPVRDLSFVLKVIQTHFDPIHEVDSFLVLLYSVLLRDLFVGLLSFELFNLCKFGKNFLLSDILFVH